MSQCTYKIEWSTLNILNKVCCQVLYQCFMGFLLRSDYLLDGTTFKRKRCCILHMSRQFFVVWYEVFKFQVWRRMVGCFLQIFFLTGRKVKSPNVSGQVRIFFVHFLHFDKGKCIGNLPYTLLWECRTQYICLK